MFSPTFFKKALTLVILSAQLIPPASYATTYKYQKYIKDIKISELIPSNPTFLGSNPYNFGAVTKGSYSLATITLKNNGTGRINGGYVELLGSSSYAIDSTTCGLSGATVNIEAGASCSIMVRYTPVNTSTESTSLRFISSNTTTSLAVTGIGQNVYPYSTQLLMNFEGSTIASSDVYSRVVSSTGAGASLSTSSYKYGTKGLVLGSSSYLTVSPMDPQNSGFEPYDFGTSNFTVDVWVMPTSCTSNNVIMGSLDLQFNATVRKGWYLFLNGSCNVGFNGFDGGGSVPLGVVSNTTLTKSVWSHLAVVRNGSTVTMYINGAVVGSTTTSANIVPNDSLVFRVGSAYVNTGMNWYYSGAIDNVRVRKGVVAWTGPFTPPDVNDY